MLIVEDGTGLPNSEAYMSADDADTYFTARGNTAWLALDVDAKEAALRAGCDWLESRYRWQGERTTAPRGLMNGFMFDPPPGVVPQALSWPRRCVVVDNVLLPSNAVPAAICRANAELALRASTAALAPDEGTQVVRETVGPITTEYQAGARQNPRFAAVEALLTPYTIGGPSGCSILRA